MKKFNESDLFTGYLKQLLHNFNLPKIKVYTKEHRKYLEKNHEESPEIISTLKATLTNYTIENNKYNTNKPPMKNVRYFPYIKDGEIQEHIDGSWVNIGHKTNSRNTRYYNYGEKILNYTKTLKINSNTYDSYTHEYLGDYLRFHRDFTGLDLMSLYNCFSDRACEKLKVNWNVELEDYSLKTVSFDTSDTNYKIYMLPVKLFKKYTIAIDSIYPVEMCCGIYGDYQDTRNKFKEIYKNTYKRVNSCQFSQPFIYDALAFTDDGKINTLIENLIPDDKIELAQNECDLKLFIKLPASNTSTIVVLEGDYRNWNESIWADTDNNKSTNSSVINLEYYDKLKTNYSDVKLITQLQLLQLNTGEQHPFADRLIEYLLGNAISNSETEVSNNIKLAQKALYSNLKAFGYSKEIPGFWSPEMNLLFYEYMTRCINNNAKSFTSNRDLLGYVDKDVEKYYNVTVYDKTWDPLEKTYVDIPRQVSLSNLELEEGDK